MQFSKFLMLVSLTVKSIHGAPYAAIIMDPCSGAIIDGVDYQKVIYPASLTKMMTFYLIFDALQRKKISLDTVFTVSRLASQQPPSRWGLVSGQKISVKQCILAMSVRSCNDVAVTVAENLTGSLKAFARLMNTTAQTLQMTQSCFYNPSGLHHPLHKSSAKDMALVLRALLLKFPQYSHFLRVMAVKKKNQTLRTTNKLQASVVGMKMGKTGYTIPAGFNLATVVVRGQTPAIFVVMGMRSAAERDAHMSKIIHTFYTNPLNLSRILRYPLKKNTLSLKRKV
jgi:D-alanyl-D-alanine carboxypeptidase